MKKGVVLILFLFPFSSSCVSTILKIIAPSDIATGAFTINEGGLYVLGNDATLTTGTALTITTSDVVLDLNGKTIRGAGGVTGIAINGGMENVTLKNGKVFGSFTTSEIAIGSGARNIVLSDLLLSGSSNNSNSCRGIYLFGGTPKTVHVFVSNCRINNNQFGIYADRVDDLSIESSTCNFNGTGVFASNCNNCYMLSCRISNNTTASSSSSFGVSLEGSRVWFIRNSEFSFNQNNSIGIGLSIATNSNTIIAEDCRFCANGTSGSPALKAAGCSISLSSSCIIKNSMASGNFSTNSIAAGIRMDSGGGSHFIDGCTADGNIVNSSLFNAYGFFVTDNVSKVSFNRCVAEGNSATSPATGVGFFVAAPVEDCFIKDSQATFNSHAGISADSMSTYLAGNVATGQETNFTGSGAFGFVRVNNGATPPRGTFDERLLSNIAITSSA